MKLYFFPVAPNPTRVRLYLVEKREGGAQFDIEEISVNLRENEQQSDTHRARNPLAKLPVLQTGDGEYLTESAAIIEYLEELEPSPAMIGATPMDRARTREFDRILEFGILNPIAEIVHATASPLGRPPNPSVAAHAEARLPAHFALINDRLSDGRPFLQGDTSSIVDCTLAAAFQFGRLAKIEIPTECEHVARWHENFRGRVSAKQILVL